MSKHLLVIEDSKQIGKVIERMGESLGYRVTIANSFAMVKELLSKDHDFFVATIDYCLPDALDGEVIPYVLEYNIPSIVMTGRMDDNTRNKILNLPIIDYITKENTQAYHYLLRILYGQINNHKMGVLVVDDSLTARNHICYLLKRRNFIVYDEPDGIKALQSLNDNDDIKIVITDQEMPGMDGVELVQKIRKDHTRNELIIIAISGANKKSQSARFIKNGADDFLRKPFCPEEFYCRVMQNIEKLQYIEKIEIAGNTDYLTSLYNRRHFLEEAHKVQVDLAKQTDSYLVVILCIEDFKTINNKYGHNFGDAMLVQLSVLLKENFPKGMIARFGGAEFGLLLSANEIGEIESQLRGFQRTANTHVVSYKEINETFNLSIGGMIVDADSSLQSLLKKADQALNQAAKKETNKLVVSGYIELSE